jgi:hypothetical protein
MHDAQVAQAGMGRRTDLMTASEELVRGGEHRAGQWTSALN